MRYRKFQADDLFDGQSFLSKKLVLITDAAGTVIDVVTPEDAGEEVEFYSGIISPAFINAHCHIELSHLKNIIPEKTGLVDFVVQVVAQKNFKKEEVLEAIKTAETEMLQNGIIAVGDICNHSVSLIQKKERRLQYYNFIEISGWHPEIAENRISKGHFFYDEFKANNLEASIVPHAPYSVSDNLWEKVIPFFSGKTVSIHNQETPGEDLFFVDGTGNIPEMYKAMNIDNSFYQPKKLRSLPGYFKKLSSAASVILVHNTFTRQQDIDFINEHKSNGQLVSFCLCPNANLYIEDSLPPVNLFIENDCQIVLGTDSLASNHQLNILEEIKTISKYFPQVKIENMLQWATSNGSRALQMDDKIGSFKKGKTPGVVLIEHLEGGRLTSHSTIRPLVK